MSGGVDSSVSAYLASVHSKNISGGIAHGFFLQNWDSFLNNDTIGQTLSESCTARIDYQDAVHVGQVLAVNVQRTSFVEEYWTLVFQRFLAQIKAGYTPNPDVLCNQMIKFDCFMRFLDAKIKGQKFTLVTGHYARTIFDPVTQQYLLLRGVDLTKDQTYFLSRLTQKILQQVYFPVGSLTKQQVRMIAYDRCLPVFSKPGSTGICFIGERKFKLFLANYFTTLTGNIIDITTNQIMGQHDGYMFYTIGQRHGLNLGGQSEPYYVVAKNVKKNIVFVAAQSYKQKWLRSDQAKIVDLNLISNDYQPHKFTIQIQFRYQQKPILGQIEIIDRHHAVVYYPPTLAVTPGQEAVFYRGMNCLGGGQVQEVFFQNTKRHLW